MEKQQGQSRMIWCNQCNEPTNSIIEYAGNKLRQGVMYVYFSSICTKCQNNKGKSITNVVLLEDYNALITKELYEKPSPKKMKSYAKE